MRESKINFEDNRTNMVKNQLIGRDITDTKVLAAMQKVPREIFVPNYSKALAYADNPLPIGHNQTISQPYIVAKICQLLDLQGDEKVLDIGAGSGYQAAILAQLAQKVFALEIIPELAIKARKNLTKANINNVEVLVGDGKKGFNSKAPFDAIASAAASLYIPDAWKKQLKIGGRIVTPIEERFNQKLLVIKKTDIDFISEIHGYVRFVPLI